MVVLGSQHLPLADYLLGLSCSNTAGQEGIPSSLLSLSSTIDLVSFLCCGDKQFLENYMISWLGRRTAGGVMLTWSRQLQFPLRTGKMLCHPLSCQL